MNFPKYTVPRILCSKLVGQNSFDTQNRFSYTHTVKKQWLIKFINRLAIYGWLGLCIWTFSMLVICIIVSITPWDRTVTPIYHNASSYWWAHKSLYNGPENFNYLPHFALLFAPFHALPVPFGDILWRCLAAGLLSSGIWRLLLDEFGSDTPKWFFWASLIALPACISSLRNGQGSAAFSGLTLHAIASISKRQFWTAALLSVLALIERPIGIVLMLLAPVVYTQLRWRVAAGLLLAAVLPFFFAPPVYVLEQFRGFVFNIRACAQYANEGFADFNGLLRPFGYQLPFDITIVICVLAGVGTLWLWCFSARRLREPFRVWWLLTLTTGYLMFFNPMNELNSYVIFAPVMGLWAVYSFRAEARRFGYWTVFFLLSTGLLPNNVRIMAGFRLGPFWYPLSTLLFFVLLMLEIWSHHYLNGNLRASR